MNRIWFYDRYGSPEIILLGDGVRFVDRLGKNIGFIKGNTIYNYKGIHCGWIEGGVIRDLNGHCVAFIRGATDRPAPIFPIPQLPPLKPIPQLPPLKPILQLPKLKPLKSFGWSSLSPLNLFGYGE